MRNTILLLSLTLILASQALFSQDQPNEIRCATGTACGTGFIPKFATSGGSATVSNSIIRQSSGNISIGGRVGIGTSTPTERLDLGNGGNVVIKTDPGSDTAQSNVAYKLIGREANAGTRTWAIYTAPTGGGFGVPANSLSIWEYPPNAQPGCCVQRFTILPAGTPFAGFQPSLVYIDPDGAFNATGYAISTYGIVNKDLNVGGCVRASNTVIGGTCQSDVRLKKDVQPFAPVLDKVARLQPVSYRWREHIAHKLPKSAVRPSNAKSFGLIAQDVERVFPEMVSSDKRGFREVNYSELPYLMLQAIRDLKAENDDLKERIKRVEQKTNQ